MTIWERLCGWLGHRWQPYRSEYPLTNVGRLAWTGRRCWRCGWFQGRLDFPGLTERESLIVRHVMEQTEAKCPGFRFRTREGDA